MKLPNKMQTKLKDSTRESVQELLDTADVGETSLTLHSGSSSSSKGLAGMALLAGAGALLAAFTLGSDTATEGPRLPFKVTRLSEKQAESLPRRVRSSLDSHLEFPEYFQIEFPALDEKPFVFSLSNVKANDTLYFHYPDERLPNPLFEGQVFSFHDLAEALIKRFQLIDDLETDYTQVLEFTDEIISQMGENYRNYLNAPVEQYAIGVAPKGIPVQRLIDHAEHKAYIIIGTNPHGANICNDFPVIQRKANGRLYLSWATDAEPKMDSEGMSAEGGVVDPSTLESLIYHRINKVWKPRYRVENKEDAAELARGFASSIWKSLPADWTGIKPAVVIAQPETTRKPDLEN